jgi:hypothetical protein
MCSSRSTGEQGPRRRDWEKLKRRRDAVLREIAQMQRDLESYLDCHPEVLLMGLDPGPWPDDFVLPALPPMPPWSE